MRIGVDATCWSNRRGYGRFARALLGAVLQMDRENEYVFFLDAPSEEFPLPSSVEVVRVRSSVPTIKAAAANGSRSLGDMWAMRRAFQSRPLDLLFFPSVYSYVPVKGRLPQIVTIHDVIPERFPELVFPTRRSKVFWNAKVNFACRQARIILTVSDYSRRCLEETLRLPSEKLRVVNEAGDPAFYRVPELDTSPVFGRLKIPANSRLLAYVGGFSPHKNLLMLARCFADAFREADFADVRLVLVGDFETDPFFSCYPRLQKFVQEQGLEQRILFPGYMKDDELRALLHASVALVLPSQCEGFGLPAVEAAACGTPVVVTTESPLPELLGEGAIALSPEDAAGWTEALRRMMSDSSLQRRMGAAALEAVGKLSWENSARQLLEVFREVHSRATAA